MTIRTFTPEDYPAICAVDAAVYPEYPPETPEEMRHSDATRDKKLKWERYVVEKNGEIVAFGGYGQSSGMYHPRKFFVGASVHPAWQGKGIGRALYERSQEALAAFDPIALRCHFRADFERSIRFATDRGFVEDQRDQESKLDMAIFDPTPFAKEVAGVEQQGIVIKSLARLKAENSDIPDLYRRLDDLHWAINQDIPHPDTLTRPPHEEFLKRFENPGFLPEGNFYALDGDQLVGGSILWGTQSSPELFTGMTGVLRDYRKRGIATALKVRALTFAKERGAPFVRTWNEINNNGMLGINFRLGFVRQPAWISMIKKLKEDENGQ